MSQFVTLLVENDLLQRTAIAELLKGRRLEVVECTTAEAAELVLTATGNELLALVTDVGLDGVMTGAELATYAHERYPDLRVVVTSGAPSPPCLPEGVTFLAKPFSTRELLNAIEA